MMPTGGVENRAKQVAIALGFPFPTVDAAKFREERGVSTVGAGSV